MTPTFAIFGGIFHFNRHSNGKTVKKSEYDQSIMIVTDIQLRWLKIFEDPKGRLRENATRLISYVCTGGYAFMSRCCRS